MSSENNNALVGKLPDHPHPLLSTLKPLVGSWTISGPEVQGGIRCSFMEGGFYFIQEIELINFGRRYSGIEYVSYDEDTKTLRSRLMGTDGARYTYTWEMDGKQRTIWFGDLGSPHFTKAEFTSDDCLEGTWQWPNSDGSSGGYAYVMKRDRYVPESTAAASAEQIALDLFDAYKTKNRAQIESLLADDFEFTSPVDNKLDRTNYLERCWPNSADMLEVKIHHTARDGRRVYVTYEIVTEEKKFRNTDVLTVKNGKVTAIEVYFGWELPHAARENGWVTARS